MILPQRRVILRNAALVLFAAFVAAGCASTDSIAARKQAHASGYEMLPPEMRAAVDQGQIKVGMSKDGVLIAWGKPTQSVHAGTSAGETTTWVYQSSYIETSRVLSPTHTQYAYTPLTYVRAQVVFVNDLVQSWQTFPAPD